jgi:hypothetical protein
MSGKNARAADLARRGSRRATVLRDLRRADRVLTVRDRATREGRCRRCGFLRNSIKTATTNLAAMSSSD